MSNFHWMNNKRKGYTRISQIGFYNSTDWKRLRNLKISNNPICEICEKEGRINPTEVIDHIIPVTVENVNEVFFDYNNLMSLCNNCHWEKTHGKRTKYNRLQEGERLRKELES